MQPYATLEGPKTREKVTVWMGLRPQLPGIFGPHFFEDDEGKAETVKTTNYIAMLRGKFIPVLKRKKILGTCYFQQDRAPPHCSGESLSWLGVKFGENHLPEG